jgi:hypothetical protein
MKRFLSEPKKTTVEAEQKYLRKEVSLQKSSPGLESYDTLAEVSKNQHAEAFLIYRHTLSLIETAIEKNSLKRMQLSVFYRSRKKLEEAFESYISDEGPTITRVTASTTVAISCAATLKVKQISPERNFEEKLKGKKKCLILELMQIFEFVLHQ